MTWQRVPADRMLRADDKALPAWAAGMDTTAFAGVAGYEGAVAHGRSGEALHDAGAFVADLVALHGTLLPRYDDPAAAIVTAGGSAFPDVAADVLAEAAARLPRPLGDPLRRVAHPRRGLLPVGVALRRRGPPARGPRDRTSGLDA
ncbi:hypothetical protein [Microbacterium lacticum]